MSISLIFSGQANIIVEPHKHPKQYPQLWPFEAGIDIYSIEFEFLRYTYMYMCILLQNKIKRLKKKGITERKTNICK